MGNQEVIEEFAETLDYELRELKPFKRTRLLGRILVKFKRHLEEAHDRGRMYEFEKSKRRGCPNCKPRV